MAQNFLTSINLNGNELQNAVVQNLGVAPSSPKAGQMFFNTSTKELNIYDGSKWVDVDFTKTNIKTILGIQDWALGNKPTYTKSDVGLGNVENTALSTWKGTSNITTLGTITSGTWNGAKIANGYLANSSVSIAGNSVSLGGSLTADALNESLGLKSLAFLDSISWSSITSGKPTTLSGYGITDAKISNGTITLGTSTIKPLTAHQTIYSLSVYANTTAVSTFTPNSSAKSLTFAAGSNITLTPDATDGKITIASVDTKNTAGSTNTSSKIFLIGATSQAANPQTYSHDTAYVGTDGLLYSGGNVVLTSHQTIYNLTMQAGAFTAVTFDPNGAAATVNIPTTTTHISEGNNKYYTDARVWTTLTGAASTTFTANRVLTSNASGKAAVSSITTTQLGYLSGATSNIQTQLNGKVSLTTNETVSGYKTFMNGIAIGSATSIPIVKMKDGVILIDGNLAVSGGVTMYADTGDVDIPSILDNLPIASTSALGIASFSPTYFSVTNGNVTIKEDSVGLNEAELANYLKSNGLVRGVADGVASLGTDGKVPSSQLPSYVDDVLEYASKANFPSSTEAQTGKIYIDLSNNKTYRWSGSTYVEISQSTIHKYVGTITGTGSKTSFAVSHGLNTDGVIVSIYENKTPYQQVWADVQMTNNSTVTVNFAVAPATTDSYKIVIIA